MLNCNILITTNATKNKKGDLCATLPAHTHTHTHIYIYKKVVEKNIKKWNNVNSHELFLAKQEVY